MHQNEGRMRTVLHAWATAMASCSRYEDPPLVSILHGVVEDATGQTAGWTDETGILSLKLDWPDFHEEWGECHTHTEA